MLPLADNVLKANLYSLQLEVDVGRFPTVFLWALDELLLGVLPEWEALSAQGIVAASEDDPALIFLMLLPICCIMLSILAANIFTLVSHHFLQCESYLTHVKDVSL